MRAVEGGVCAPKGFKAAGVAAGIKPGSTKLDCALIVSAVPAAVAGMFTKNVMKSPPVYANIEVCRGGHAQVVFINSGNANAATGEQGEQDVEDTVEHLSERTYCYSYQICFCSTGVIGVPLPMDRIAKGIDGSVDALSEDGSLDAAMAIMTTDTVPKEFACAIELSTGTVRLGAIAKGSGMISPDLATMIVILTSDATVAPDVLDGLLRAAVDASFHRICIDNDMSTSDTVLLLANGESKTATLEPGTDDYEVFARALTGMCETVAKALVKDGEGATKFVEIQVSGAPTDDDAKKIARAIGNSQLCKTAFFGEDANWGRFACAAGYAGVDFDPANLDIFLDGVQLCAGGLATGYKEEDATAIMQLEAFTVRLCVGHGQGTAAFWTSDLSHGYVSINADYRT